MYLIGLTGGIAAGKSTVAKLWRELGGIEIDADQLAREVVEAGSEGANQILEKFGESFFSEDGTLDRKKLGAIVFSDQRARLELEAIVHPLVRRRALEILANLSEEALVVYNVPLLVEAKVDLPFDVIVTVEAPEDERVQRLINNRGMTVAEAKARIDNQAKPIDRAQIADHILNSNQSIELLLNEARALWAKFQKDAALK
ncbi:MAG: dephospho-CoA kinase [Micrococcales bacterium]|nr:dephospho-CoA kinase [Micrococcales bacterium]NBR54567.1 dephospho-CoA kinase [Micrococcales bacterium]NBR60571.1 dephospho-CoA kinase [Actinomycetota bacterium]NBY44293.1 dephospho-CoA kinase [Micrococcales bacterium]NDE88377.1 dephospho-CoA kinase [Micrococcales bacterium]